jgi:hypothetical protein
MPEEPRDRSKERQRSAKGPKWLLGHAKGLAGQNRRSDALRLFWVLRIDPVMGEELLQSTMSAMG